MVKQENKEVITLRWSAIHAFMKCQRKYAISYIENLRRVVSVDNMAQILGSHVHYGIQAALTHHFYHTEAASNDPQRLVKEAVKAIRLYNQETTETNKQVYDYQTRTWRQDVEYYTMMSSVLEQAIEIVRYQIPRIGIGTQYAVASVGEVLRGGDVSHYVGKYDPNIPMVEWQFAEPFEYRNHQYLITGTVDAVLRDIRTGEYIIFDWKTRGVMSAANLVDMDGQLKLYAAIINKIVGMPIITRTCQYQIKSSVPKPARLTPKKKELSLAGNINSTWEIWSASVRALGIDPEKYRAEMEGKLKKPEDFTFAVFSPVTQKSSDIVLMNTLAIGEAIRFSMDRGYFPAIPSHLGCRFCEFKPLCRVIDFGGDVDYVRQHEYVTAEPKYGEDELELT